MTNGGSHEDLDRFLTAQAPVIGAVMAELARGRKETHWMWFVFPQLRGLGRSEMAWRYGIADLSEAVAYIGHPVLGPRLRAGAELVLSHSGQPPEQIMGVVDAMKLRSCATLFERAVPGASIFDALIAEVFMGERCSRTADLLAA